MVSGERSRENREGEPWGERSQLRQIKGKHRRREGWARSPGCVSAKLRASEEIEQGEAWFYQLSSPCYTSDDALNQSNKRVSLSCPGPGS